MSDTGTTAPKAQGGNESIEKFQKLTVDKNPVLYTFSSVFPLDLFPTRISIEKTQVNIIDKLFWGSDEVRSVLISHISDVQVTTAWVFSTLLIRTMLPNQPPINVPLLWTQQALKARNIIQGLMAGVSQNIDFSEVPTDQLRMQIEELGEAKAIQ